MSSQDPTKRIDSSSDEEFNCRNDETFGASKNVDLGVWEAQFQHLTKIANSLRQNYNDTKLKNVAHSSRELPNSSQNDSKEPIQSIPGQLCTVEKLEQISLKQVKFATIDQAQQSFHQQQRRYKEDPTERINSSSDEEFNCRNDETFGATKNVDLGVWEAQFQHLTKIANSERENNNDTKLKNAKNVTPDSSKTTDGIEKENNREEVENNTKREQSRFVPPDSSKTTDSVENKTGSDEKNKPRVRKLYRPDENIGIIFNWDDQPIKEKNIEITTDGIEKENNREEVENNTKRRQSRFVPPDSSKTTDSVENKTGSDEKNKPRVRKLYRPDENIGIIFNWDDLPIKEKNIEITDEGEGKKSRKKFKVELPKGFTIPKTRRVSNITKRGRKSVCALNFNETAPLKTTSDTDLETKNSKTEISNERNVTEIRKDNSPTISPLKRTRKISSESNLTDIAEISDSSKSHISNLSEVNPSKRIKNVLSETNPEKNDGDKIEPVSRTRKSIRLHPSKTKNTENESEKSDNEETEPKTPIKSVQLPKGFTIPKTRRVSNITKRGRKSVCALNFNETAPLKTTSDTDLETKNSKTEISNERNVTEIRKDNSPTISPLKRTRKISSESNLTDIAEISDSSKSHISNLSEVNPSKRIKNVLSETNPEKNDGDKIEPVSRTRKSIRLHPSKTKNTENESEKSDNEETEPKTPIKSVQKSRRQSEAPAKLLKNKILGTSPWESTPTSTVRRSQRLLYINQYYNE